MDPVSTRKKTLAFMHRPQTKGIWEALPLALGLWSKNHRCLSLNAHAQKLSGFLQAELEKDPLLWPAHIHPQDRPSFLAFWEKLKEGSTERGVCDYRFFPKGKRREIWLHESAALVPLGRGEGVLSAYEDISDLKRGEKEAGVGEGLGMAELIRDMVHEVQNALQAVSMGVDMLSMEGGDPEEAQRVYEGIERASRLLREVREYLGEQERRTSWRRLGEVVEEAVRGVQKQREAQGVDLEVVKDRKEEEEEADWFEVRKALERLLRFCCSLVQEKGEVRVEVQKGEVRVKVRGREELGVSEEEIFNPYLRIGSYQAGISLQLVRRAVEREGGRVSFRKEGSRQATFVLSLKHHP